MNILSTLEGWATSIWGEAVTIEHTVVSRVENGVQTLLNDAKGFFSKFTADEYTLFRAFSMQALTDVTTGNVADLETAVLNLAEKAGLTFVADLGSPTIQAGLAMLQVSHMAAAPVNAPTDPGQASAEGPVTTQSIVQ